MSNRILVNPGTEQAWVIPLNPGVNRIGRGEQNDFTINHPSISPAHCEITVTGDGVLLKDLGSAGGSFVNGSPVGEVRLRSGQRLQFGAIAGIFEADPPVIEPPMVGRAAPGATVVVAAFGASTSTPTSDLTRPPTNPVEYAPVAKLGKPSSVAPRSAGPLREFPVHLAAKREASERRSLIRGFVGAAVGSLIGMIGWYFLIQATNSTFGFVAWGIGVVTGLGGRLLARKGSLGLGIFSAVCALLAIVLGEYLAVKSLVGKEGAKMADEVYFAKLAYAQEAVQADSPEKIRAWLAGKNKAVTEISEAEVQTFREEELPELRDFALGKPTREEFSAALGTEVARHFDYKNYFFKEEVKAGLFLLLFAGLGIVSAYKIGAGEKDD